MWHVFVSTTYISVSNIDSSISVYMDMDSDVDKVCVCSITVCESNK